MKQLFITLSLLIFSGTLMSQTAFTNADGDHQWLNANNWSAGLPSLANPPIIDATDSIAIVLTAVENFDEIIVNEGTICVITNDFNLAFNGEIINNGTIRFKKIGLGMVNFDMFTNNGEVISNEVLNNFEFIRNNGIFRHSGIIDNAPNITGIENNTCGIFIVESTGVITDGDFNNNGIVYILNGDNDLVDVDNGMTFFNINEAASPTANCITTPYAVQLVGANPVIITPANIDDGSDVAYCSAGSSLSLSPMQFDCDDIGDNIVTLTVEDGFGNTATCTATVSIIDVTSPTITCPSSQIINLEPGECDTLLTFDVQGLDNCATPTVIELGGYQVGTPLPIGVTSLTFQVIGANGNSATCPTATVEVVEYVPQSDAIACNTNLQVSLDSDCEACITPDMVLEGDYGCFDDFTVQVGTSIDNCVGFDDIGQTIVYTVTYTVDGNSCDGLITVEDKFPPILDCSDVTLSCAAPFDKMTPSFLTTSDNCSGVSTPTLIDLQENLLDCADVDYIATMTRTWQVMDDFGNIETCQQLIRIERGELVDVIFPNSSTIPCGSDTSPTNTGFPTIDGTPIMMASEFCNLQAFFTDQFSVNNCSPNNFTIFRTWTVDDRCGGFLQMLQTIKVKDDAPPVLVCPGDLDVSTNTGNCSANFQLPPPVMVTDACSDVSVSVSIDGILTSQLDTNFVDVPVGTYEVTYFAEDACGNIDSCKFNLNVVDDVTPIAVCKEDLTVNLSSLGVDCIPAETFDDGSIDNCMGALDFMVSRDMVNFADCVEFDCDDVGNVIMVAVQVTNTVNPSVVTSCMVEVRVFDKIAPTLLCPIDLTVDCSNYISDLSVFGAPTVLAEACEFTISSDSLIDISNCGEGTITRTFTATDNSGNERVCTQTITLQNMNPFDGTGIIFPNDVEIFDECPQIEDLAVGLLPSDNEPILPTVPCALLAVNYKDQVFNINFPACYKIVRTWTVLDWCQYDPDASTPTGIFTSQQIIKVTDTVAPDIKTCASDITVSLDANCEFGDVVVDPITATDCSPGIEITNNSPVTTTSGADASGLYPAGVHTVNFFVRDGCGNVSDCAITITVEDLKRPTPYCKPGIHAELQDMGGGLVLAMLDAEQMDDGSFDNCTAQEDLIFNIGTAADTLAVPTTTMLTFDCTHIGNNVITIWITDENGNSDYCVTNVDIQDNMELCDDDDALVAGISGDVMTEMGMMVEEVTVVVSSGSNALPDITLSSGSFAVPNLPLGQNYEVIPEKDVDIKNGVSTYDLVLLRKHILGMEFLDSPYKVIAADINHSGGITTSDMVALRKVILEMTDAFPNNESWRFVDMNYDFINPANPLLEDFPEVIAVDGLPPQGVETDFYGIKIGDLNDNANANSLMSADDRNFVEKLSLKVDNQQVEPGETVTIDFKAKDFNAILGFQFTFQFEADKLNFTSFEAGNLPSLEEENFNFQNLEDGIITSSWFDLKSPKLTDETVLFSFTFEANTAAPLSDLIRLSSTKTIAEAYNADEELMNIDLSFDQIFDDQKAFELLQNHPNPFSDETMVDFYLPTASKVALTVFDVDGKTLKTYTGEYQAGWQQMTILGSDLPAKGVMYYQLETATEVATQKMIKM